MANPLAISLHTSGAETVSGFGAAVDIGAIRSCARLLLDVTAIVGTLPSIVVSVETSVNGTTGWRSVGQFDTVAALASQRRTFAQCERYVRASWTISGTGGPAFTFAVTGEAHVLYATPDDLVRSALPAEALVNVAPYAQADALLSVTDEADGYIGGAYTLPLTAWGEDLRMHVAAMGAFAVLKRRGFDPSGKDELIVKGRDDAIAWLRRILNGQLAPPGLVDSTPDEYEGGAYVVTRARRGW